MPSIFDGLDEIINRSFGIDQTWIWRGTQLDHMHRKTLQELCKGRGRDVDGPQLVKELLEKVNSNWDQSDEELRGVPPNQNNWRRLENLDLDPNHPGDEVTLERTITQVTDGNWWNQIPVEQALLGIEHGRVVDLVHRDGVGGRDFEIIELKTGNPYTPLSAASQVLKYGIVYAFYRSRLYEIFPGQTETELLNATRLKLIVLAPWGFYRKFATCDWLVQFESSLQDALLHISTNSGLNLPEMSFQFQSFPKDFEWAAEMANSEQGRKEALWAVHHRTPVFTKVKVD